MVGRTPWSKGLSAETDKRIKAISDSKRKDVIDKDTLQEFYVEQNLALHTIGERYNVSKHTVKRLVNEYQLCRKRELLTQEIVESLYWQGYSYTDIGNEYNCSSTFVSSNFGQRIDARRARSEAGESITHKALYELYWDQWMSYEAIAETLNVDLTAIPYWLSKFDIPKRSAWETKRGINWQPPDPEIVIHLYQAENMGMRAIGNLFDVGRGLIKRILVENDIEIRASGYPNISQFVANDGHCVKSSLELQVDNWLHQHGVDHEYEPALGNTKKKADFKVGDIYIEIWGIVGNEKYERKKQHKLALYKKFELSLLSVYPEHFPDLNILECLIQKSL